MVMTLNERDKLWLWLEAGNSVQYLSALLCVEVRFQALDYSETNAIDRKTKEQISTRYWLLISVMKDDHLGYCTNIEQWWYAGEKPQKKSWQEKWPFWLLQSAPKYLLLLLECDIYAVTRKCALYRPWADPIPNGPPKTSHEPASSLQTVHRNSVESGLFLDHTTCASRASPRERTWLNSFQVGLLRGA